jgi:class 3 adenylate cyclase/tetratricopeptide (TPR) repeat protein
VALSCPSCSAPNDDEARFCSSCGARLARTCPACGASVPLRARFCQECGTQIGEDAPSGATPVEERRIVSILFADLAGFTQRSDRADPEDVRRILVPFHELAKEEIQRFGGTLDKFIGDAAMGVFGAPVAHEDDAERAVRAALAIRDRVNAMQMPVRAAVTTGEAVVSFGSGPQIGESVAGDVVNTASRIQSVAPIGGVVVGEATRRATRGIVAYESMGDVDLKGKAEPVAIWRADDLLPSALDRDEDDPPPFVGRARERLLLRELLERTERERCPHLVTVVGEPGIGKTRLLADLGESIRAQERSTGWFRGRCLPYGESITFAALEEAVRSVVGVAPGDGRERIAEKLGRAVSAVDARDADREWLRDRLAPLLGLPGEDDTAAPREELFTAWTRFLEAEADRRPVILVIEDLHWADDAMLEFLDHLVSTAGDVPLFVLVTARPELFTAHPTWGGGKANATTISLSPLGEAEMRELLGALLLRSVLPADTQSPLMSRAGGNPLYALEFVHMLEDQDIDPSDLAGDGAPVIRVPESVQALIAARLDSLGHADRALLQDAAVVGDRFWAAALRALDPAVADLERSLRELQRRGLIRRDAVASAEGDGGYAFAHALIRDVAYGQLPRAERARRHRVVAEWLAATGDDRGVDRSDLLASHAVRALELARTAGMLEDLPALESSARQALKLAGDRQMALDMPRAGEYYRQALTLTPADAPERPELIRLATSVGWRTGELDSDTAIAAYREGIDLALAHDDKEGAAGLMRRLYFQLGLSGETGEATEVLDQAIDLLADLPPGPVLAELYASRSEAEMFAGRSEASLDWAARALSVSGAPVVRLMALHLRGNARCELGDMEGVDDLREALALARTDGSALDIVTSYSYLNEWIAMEEGPRAALAMNVEAVELCEQRGLPHQAFWSRTESLWLRFDAGEWDEILALSDELEAWARDHGEVQMEAAAASYRARVLAHRGDVAAARPEIERLLPLARTIEDLQILAPALISAALVEEASGAHAEALARLREFDELTDGGPAEYREIQSAEVARVAIAAGDPSVAARVVGDRAVHSHRVQLSVASGRALLAEAAGDIEAAEAAFEEAATGWAAFGIPLELGVALAGRARCLRALGRDAEAGPVAQAASATFEGLGVAHDGARP